VIAERSVAGLESNFTQWQSAAARTKAGGDWCDVIPIASGIAALTIGDAAGHGPAASLAMAAVRAAVFEAIVERRFPAGALVRANAAAHEIAGGTITTAIVAVLDERERTLTFANAGHPPPLIVTALGQTFMATGVADIPLGIFSTYHAAECVVALPADSLVVFYTDGITEHRRDPVGGERELMAAARAVYGRPGINASRAIARRVFSDCRGTDDAATMCLRTAPDRS
jgi:serine phosphatase RsbU (regulator of sigma subunit)